MEMRERRPATLREKLRAKYHNREFNPDKMPANKMAMTFFFALVLISFIQCLYCLIPHLYTERSHYWLAVGLMCFILVELVVNWHRSYWDVDNYVRGTTKEKYFPGVQDTPEDWKLCPKCQVDAPPRSHHCNHCGKCMLKRDHHCFFTGSCIGFYNQKFYVVFCIYSLIASLFVMFLQLSYLHLDLPILSWDVITYLPPVTLYRWIAGAITFGQVFIIAHFYVLIFTSVLAIFFFLWQMVVITNGVTSHEGWKGIFVFQGNSTTENINSVFGSAINIPIMILLPIRFEQIGDGILWTRRSKRVKGH